MTPSIRLLAIFCVVLKINQINGNWANVPSIPSVGSQISCLDVTRNNSTFVGTCTNNWSEIKSVIKPCQPEVGYAWVQYKLETIFTSQKNAQTELDDNPPPLVIGPDRNFYLVDDHHTLASLDYSGFDVSITFHILCDMSSLSLEDFWASMTSNNFAYLAAHPPGQPNTLPVPIHYSQLPSSFTFTSKAKTLSDDPWRALASYSRKVLEAPAPAPKCTSSDNKYCERSMYRGCVDGTMKSGKGVFFFEFRWGYFMNEVSLVDPASWWPSNDTLQTFLAAYNKLPSTSMTSSTKLENVIKSDDWLAAASLTVPLCRNEAVGKYLLPESMFPDFGSKLPGFIIGYEKLPGDPICDYPTCSAARNRLASTVRSSPL